MERATAGWGSGMLGVAIFSGSLPATRVAVADFPPIFLTSTGTAVPRASRSAEWHPLDGWQAVHLSFLAFGNTYGVVVKASSAWLAAHPLRHGVTAAAAGLLLTAVMTAFPPIDRM